MLNTEYAAPPLSPTTTKPNPNPKLTPTDFNWISITKSSV